MSKLSVAFHSVASALNAKLGAVPAGIDTGRLKVVLSKIEDVTSAIENGLDTATKGFLDNLIAEHGGILAAPAQAVADPIVDGAFGVAEGATSAVIEGVGEKVADLLDSAVSRIESLFGSHAQQVTAAVQGVTSAVADHTQQVTAAVHEVVAAVTAAADETGGTGQSEEAAAASAAQAADAAKAAAKK